jgi:hypothetical protein
LTTVTTPNHTEVSSAKAGAGHVVSLEIVAALTL